MAGLVLENGPLRIQDDLSIKANEFAWSTLADMFWIDNPVGAFREVKGARIVIVTHPFMRMRRHRIRYRGQQRWLR